MEHFFNLKEHLDLDETVFHSLQGPHAVFRLKFSWKLTPLE